MFSDKALESLGRLLAVYTCQVTISLFRQDSLGELHAGQTRQVTLPTRQETWVTDILVKFADFRNLVSSSCQ
jgi:hypothetical protein